MGNSDKRNCSPNLNNSVQQQSGLLTLKPSGSVTIVKVKKACISFACILLVDYGVYIGNTVMIRIESFQDIYAGKCISN